MSCGVYNVPRKDGFSVYRIHMKEPAYESDEEGNSNRTDDTEIYVGQIVFHDGFIPSLANKTYKLQIACHSAGASSVLTGH